MPERHYDLAGQILADAIQDAASDDQPILTAVARAAAAGCRVGARARAVAADSTAPVSAAEILASCGYEPRVQGDRVILVNCPFHALAKLHTDLVCGMNLEFVTALAQELGHVDVAARLEPAPQPLLRDFADAHQCSRVTVPLTRRSAPGLPLPCTPSP
jgi:predicted ArsR family transcriptional regulator